MAKDLSKTSNIVFICNGDSCLKKGAEENTKILRQTLIDHSLHEVTHTIKTKCSGQCTTGPMVFMYPQGIWYKEINHFSSKAIVTEHLLKGRLLLQKIFFVCNTDSTSHSKQPNIILRLINKLWRA